MAPTPGSAREAGSRDSPNHHEVSLSEEEAIDVQSADSDTEDIPRSRSHTKEKQPEPKRTRSTSPAYVAPIPKIGPIPPVLSRIDISSSTRPQLPESVGNFLVGRRVDEFGDIVDDRTGTVLARAGGDLPSIVGRTVSNARGDILGDDGELLGYVADLALEQNANGQSPSLAQFPGTKKMSDVMRQSKLPLIVDPLGNILDTSGNVVGKFHDNNNPMHRKEREKQHRESGAGDGAAGGETATSQEEPPKTSPSATPRPGTQPDAEQGRREEQRSENRQNAQSWRKENESPSDIFLDVKSTTEGIQLTIRIPTVFNGSQVQPRVQFS